MEVTDIQKKTLRLMAFLPEIDQRLQAYPHDAEAIGMLDEIIEQLAGMAKEDYRIYHVLNPLIPWVDKVHKEFDPAKVDPKMIRE